MSLTKKNKIYHLKMNIIKFLLAMKVIEYKETNFLLNRKANDYQDKKDLTSR